MASLQGWRLYRTRYSSETGRLVDEAKFRETWTVDQWRVWQDEQLARVLWHAARNVPYYRRQWEARRKRGDTSSIELLQNWPILTKESLRANNKAFISDTTNLPCQLVEHTSGTTGTPVSIFTSREAIRHWYALSEARWRDWYGVTRHDRWGIFGGRLVAPFSQTKPPFWVWNASLKQLYLSSYHLASENIPFYLDSIQNHEIVYLLGYASSLFSLVQFASEQNVKGPKLKCVISNAEPLYQHQRVAISGFFQCPVYDTYGLSENVCAASECSAGSLHLWPEVGVTEIIDDVADVSLANGSAGRIVCTGFLNSTMPLIRYDVGDRGFMSLRSHCACGRHLPVLGGIEGRKDDTILTRDGRRIGRLDPVFKENLRIREAQIVQEDLDNIVVKYVPAPGCSAKDLELLTLRLAERVGKIQIVLKAVERIPRVANGKFKAVVSNLKMN